MIVSPITSFYMKLEQALNKELKKGGILEEVETIINESYHDEYIELPLLWIEKQPITPGTIGHLSTQNMSLQVPINIICCAEENTNLSTAEAESLCLASKCITSILHNIGEHVNVPNTAMTIRNIQINTIDPTGTFEITNKRIIIPRTKIEFTFEITVDWMNYENIKENKTEIISYDELTSIKEINIENIQEQ